MDRKDEYDRRTAQHTRTEHMHRAYKLTDGQESRKRPKNRKEGQEKRTRQEILTGCTERTNIHDRQAEDL